MHDERSTLAQRITFNKVERSTAMAQNLQPPVELTEAELDLVAAGQGLQIGLVNLQATIDIEDSLNDVVDLTVTGNRVEILSRNTGNTVQVGIGAGVAVLSGAAVGLVRQIA
jgi:hypothetical protein